MTRPVRNARIRSSTRQGASALPAGVVRVALGLALSLTVAGPALAVDWARVGGKSTGVEVYVNRHSVQREEASARAWVMWDFTAEQETSDGGGRPFRSHKAMLLIDCDKRELAVARFAFYTEGYGKGEQFGKQETPRADLNYLQADPDTVSDAIVDMVCKVKPPRKRK